MIRWAFAARATTSSVTPTLRPTIGKPLLLGVRLHLEEDRLVEPAEPLLHVRLDARVDDVHDRHHIAAPVSFRPWRRTHAARTPGSRSSRSTSGPGEAERADRVGEPGSFPFTRGVYPDMYRGRLWTMRQYAGMGSADETNRRFRYLLDHGQTGLSVAFDLPTQMGLDSDHPRAEGEVGKTGVAIDSIEDMERLFDGIPLDQVSTSMTINATAPILLLLYELVAEEQGIDAGDALGHGPERPVEGVRGARDVHLPAAAVDAPDHGPVRVRG